MLFDQSAGLNDRPSWINTVRQLNPIVRHGSAAMTQGSNANAEASRDANPYAPPQINAYSTSDSASLTVPASIAMACCVVSLGLWLLALIVSLPYGHPNAPSLIEILGFTGMFMVLPGLGLAGAVSMLQRKRYALSLIGACSMMIPLVGPCFGLTIPVGIWALVLLRRQSIRESFAKSVERSPDGYDDPDDAIAAASRLDRNGDWDAAVALYRSAASRWPDHADYAERCIEEIAEKQAATS